PRRSAIRRSARASPPTSRGPKLAPAPGLAPPPLLITPYIAPAASAPFVAAGLLLALAAIANPFVRDFPRPLREAIPACDFAFSCSASSWCVLLPCFLHTQCTVRHA